MNYRTEETQTILNLLCEEALPSSLLVLGPSSAGKFSTVEHCVNLTRHKATVINSLGCYSPRSVYEGVLLNILAKNNVENLPEIISEVSCKSGSNFVRKLQWAFSQRKISSLCLIFRNAEKLLDVLDNSTLCLLARLREHARLNLCCIFISTAPVQRFFARPDFQTTVVTFRPYTADQLLALCKSSMKCPDDMQQSMFDWFVEFLFRSVQSITQDLIEIRYLMTACLPRFHRMLLELSEGGKSANLLFSPSKIGAKGSYQSLSFSHLHKQLAFIVELVCQHGVYSRSLADVTAVNNECSTGLLGFLPRGSNATLLPAETALSHLSAQAKLLLIAAFVAAKNAPSTDRLLFESKMSKAENKFMAKQRRRNERAKTANVNPVPQPPRMFRLRRLVSIYEHFASIASLHKQQQDDDDGDVSDVISSDVMNAVTSLVDLRLLSAARSKDALANPAYYCSLPYEDVARIAKSVNIANLEAYLDDFGAGGGAAFDNS